MVSNSVVDRRTIPIKQTNTKMPPKIEQMQFMYATRPLVKRKRYTNWEKIMHPNNNKPTSTLSLNGQFLFNRFVELMPRIAYCA